MPRRAPVFTTPSTERARASGEARRNSRTHSRYGGGSGWAKLRARKILDNPLCERCSTDDRPMVADTVHHTYPVERYPEQRLNYDLLRSVCRDCHTELHKLSGPVLW